MAPGGWISNIAKSQKKPKDEFEEQTLLAMWTARLDVGRIKCTAAAFSPNADLLAIGSNDGATSMFNPKTGRLVSKLGAAYTKETDLMSMLADNGRGIVMALKFNPAPGVKPRLRVALSDGKVECFDPITGASSGLNVVDGGQTLALDYATDGTCYAAGGVDPTTPGGGGPAVRVYDDKTSKLKMTCTGDATVPGHSNRISCIRFQNSSQLATGSMDGAV